MLVLPLGHRRPAPARRHRRGGAGAAPAHAALRRRPLPRGVDAGAPRPLRLPPGGPAADPRPLPERRARQGRSLTCV